MSKTRIAQIAVIIAFVALIFYNLGIAMTLKNLKPTATANGYEIEVFGEVFTYED